MELPRPNLTDFDAVFCKKTAVHFDSGKGFFLGDLFSPFVAFRGPFFRVFGGFPKMRGVFQKCGGISLVPDGLQQCCRKYFLIKLAPRFSRIVGEPPAILENHPMGTDAWNFGPFLGG